MMVSVGRGVSVAVDKGAMGYRAYKPQLLPATFEFLIGQAFEMLNVQRTLRYYPVEIFLRTWLYRTW
jgi:hypothetical protein